LPFAEVTQLRAQEEALLKVQVSVDQSEMAICYFTSFCVGQKANSLRFMALVDGMQVFEEQREERNNGTLNFVGHFPFRTPNSCLHGGSVVQKVRTGIHLML